MEKLTEVAEKETARRTQQVQDKFASSVCSIYGVLDSKTFPHLGSGTVVRWEAEFWLLTARHLVKAGRKAQDFFAVTSNCSQPVSMTRRFVLSGLEQDLALCALNAAEVQALNVQPIDGRDFFSKPQPVTGRALCTLGWPNSKNKLDRYSRKAGSQMIVAGPQRAATDLGLKLEDDALFLFQKYHPSGAIDENRARLNAPNLEGLSGGLTLDLGNPVDPRALLNEDSVQIHPVGICTKYDPHKRMIRSTRPAEFIRALIESNTILEC
ncbi:hypothetical protein [uncultured Hyphomonas sp.]|uniref:hypothetical protein n=1 Tax=uncultured Hyphomonas sp. TaxID=225298 RepID=UPI002AAB5259|nr:hypothetical protein [uncultured Hyphomonas sp.]